jgi:hypothetical protein
VIIFLATRVDFADGLAARRVEEVATEIERDLRQQVADVDQVFLAPTG